MIIFLALVLFFLMIIIGGDRGAVLIASMIMKIPSPKRSGKK